VDKVFALSDIKHAHEYLEKSEQIGKVILLPE
jgi:NADPH:quinone reductase-like Zn-dependent oxidoreductase